MLLSSSNRKYPLFPLFSYFPWFCVWDVCHIIFCDLLYIHSWKTGNLISLVLCSFWWVQIVGFVLACISHSFVCTLHHLIIIKHILSVIHYTICGAVCFQCTHFLCDDWENIYVYFVLLSSSNRNGMRCMSFYILINDNFGLCLLWAGCHEKKTS